MANLFQKVEASEGRLLARLRELVEVESPSDNKAAVDRANALVIDWAEAMGANTVRHAQTGYGDVIELRFGELDGFASQSKGVLLLGHLDTVWPLGTLAGMPWREDDGKIFGPGVVDMKAGVVMALEAIAAVRESGRSPRVTLLLNSEEEVGSPVSRSITEALARKHDAVFVLEPAQGLAYKTARKGVGHFDLHIEGVGAHAGVDFEKGHSAVLEMARLVQEVSTWTDLSRGLTVNAGVIAGGTRSNVIAAECRAEVDVRVVSMSDAAEIEAKFQALRTSDPACRLTVTGGINRPPMERGAGTVALFEKARGQAAELGFALEEASTGGGSDGNFTAAVGVPTLDGMGAVGGGAHAAHEHVVKTHLVERTAMLAGMIAAIQGDNA
ncbi:MAG TPA: M20 family metallopeptidase [Acidobacteriaceae bacterium]|jgi:glutamate carboxypeptidase